MCDNIDKYINNEMIIIKKHSNQIRDKLNQMIKKSVGIKRLEGLEFMLKTKKSAKRKIKGICNISPGRVVPPGNIRLWDLLRFTIIYNNKSKIFPFMKKLHKLSNYNVIYERWSSCGNNPYGDIYYNITFKDIIFELQFHTEESFKKKEEVFHPLYETWREDMSNCQPYCEMKKNKSSNGEFKLKSIINPKKNLECTDWTKTDGPAKKCHSECSKKKKSKKLKKKKKSKN